MVWSGKMIFKLRLDQDLYQRLLLALLSSLLFSYLASYLLYSLTLWVTLVVPLSLALATAQSSLQLEVGDKSVLITGCDTGFGLSLAKHLASLGFNVFAGCLLADKDGPGATELRGLASPRLKVIQLDITRQEDWDNALVFVKENLISTSSGLWGIVNNAGWATFGEVEWVSIDTYKKAMDINVFGMISGIKTFLPLIRSAKGRVVTITSGLGRMAVPTRSPYCLTKYALEGFHDCLRYEMKAFGVSVSILEPGNFIAGTNIFNETFVKGQAELMWNNMDTEIKDAYGKDYFNQKVEIMRSYMNNGIPDIMPVINTYTDALLDVFPQARYQPMDTYFKVRCFIATHLPEAVYDYLYIGHARR